MTLDQSILIHGSNRRRHTRRDAMSVRLGTVGLDGWRDVVRGSLKLVREGEGGLWRTPGWRSISWARSKRQEFPAAHGEVAWKERVQDAIEHEIVFKLQSPRKPALARLSVKSVREC